MDGDSKSNLIPAATTCAGQPTGPQPPKYYMPADNAAFGFGPGPAYQHQQQGLYNTSQPHAVVATQPVYVGGTSVPNTTCALVFATLSAILCGFWCGAASIVFAWKARMQTLKQKYEHARHSLCIAWIFFSIACVFGLVIWGLAVSYISTIFYLYRSNNY